MSAFLIPLPIILMGWALAGGSPGPATLAISGTSMAHGRRAGVQVALGVVTGSAIWGIMAGLGFSAVMMAHVWLFEVVRYAGAAYLLYLAIKALRSAWKGDVVVAAVGVKRGLFWRGLTLHLTNPKAILSWGAIYAIALAPGVGSVAVWGLFAALSLTSITVFVGYALLFSTPVVVRIYCRSKRVFETCFGLLFGAASLRLLTARLQ